MTIAKTQIFTQATNFIETITGGVDPRTGLYSVTLPIAQLNANDGHGPDVSLDLRYSALSSIDTGFGLGFTGGLSLYDNSQSLLCLSSGEQYKVVENDNGVTVQQKKLNNFNFKKINNNEYIITYKSGVVERLKGAGNAEGIKVPYELQSTTGQVLYLEWAFESGGQRERALLQTIYDSKGIDKPLLSMRHESGIKVTADVLPGKLEGYRVELAFQNDLLDTLTNYSLGANQPLTWKFGYDKVGQAGEWGRWLTEVTMPGGTKERADYGLEGHAFPDSAKLAKLPFVTHFTRRLGNGTVASESDFSFSSTNFLGGHSGVTWSAGQDNLYGILTDYVYYSEEIQKSSNERINIKRVYNHYHLLTAEERVSNRCKLEIKTDYYALGGKSFDEQPACFQLPKLRKETRTNPDGASVTAITWTQFDEFANPISKSVKDESTGDAIEPGISWEYYSTDGQRADVSGLGCPPDPLGFKRFVKTVTQVPLTKNHGEELRVVRFAYVAPDKSRPDVILKSSELVLSGDTQSLLNKTFTYSTQSGDLGRLTAVEEEWLGSESGARKCRYEYSVSKQDESLLCVDTFISHDKKKLTTTQTRSRFTGRVTSHVDASGNQKLTTYDKAGRVLTETISGPVAERQRADSQALHRQYDYLIDEAQELPLKIKITDFDGRKYLREMDSLGRIACERVPVDPTSNSTVIDWPRISEFVYDEFGREKSSTSYDYVLADGQAKDTLKHAIERIYDGWGAEFKRISDNGLEEYSQFDPVTLTRVSSSKGGALSTAKKVVTYNRSGHAVSVALFNDDGTEVGRRTMVRDGWNRVVTDTDAAGNTVRYAYDAFDRIVNIRNPDGTELTREYAGFTAESLITKIFIKKSPMNRVDGSAGMHGADAARSMGSQEFDGLGRLVSSTVSGRTWSFKFDSDADRSPSTVVDPMGKVRKFGYAPITNEIESVEAGDVSQQFSYNPLTNAIKSAITEGCKLTREYNASGYLKAEVVKIDGQSEKKIQNTWTLRGALQSSTDVCGSARKMFFDQYGRVIRVSENTVDVSLNYDALNRLTSWKTVDTITQHAVETKITFDDAGREIKRTLDDNKHGCITIDQGWSSISRLANRTTTTPDVGSKSTVRKEAFVYDNNGRLKNYSCTETPSPAGANRVVEQNFTYDAFGNIVSAGCRFSDGTTDDISFVYGNADDPCQLTEIKHTHPDYPKSTKCLYDKAGRLISEGNRSIEYDALGRLKASSEKKYAYDALNRLVKSGDAELYYDVDLLKSEIRGSEKISYVRSIDRGLLAERQGAKTVLAGIDGKLSVVHVSDGNSAQRPVYGPYGEGKIGDTPLSILAYNGERVEQDEDSYNLGNGYRQYSTALMRFQSPDGPSDSPFGLADINHYAYCGGDPVNYADPSGRLGWQSWIGIASAGIGLVLTAFSGALAIAAATGIVATATAIGVTAAGALSGVTSLVGTALSEVSPVAFKVLKWISLGAGLLSFAFGVSGIVTAARSVIKDLGIRAAIGTMGVASRINLGFTATAYLGGTVSYGTVAAKRVLDQTNAANSTADNVLSNISFYSGLLSDVASIAGFVHPRMMRLTGRAGSWDVPELPLVEEFSMRTLGSPGHSWDLPQPGGAPGIMNSLMPQIQTFYVYAFAPTKMV
ncbi:RHS repeat-associated protein [Paraburkholderia sp. BL6665CI2N2]|uniref:RHS repeat-associated core domain-containing protein n=1 Tax=Paraburkholderia sp. BL6665CI2N2 TaxID=1938806 RepID=UPI001065C68F|nr:RHS repeat-associated core domain-containing protein [Paraburkholderia sp. BL6665CI2N2]TDY16717.1 RHS repeat-associated protein [Paraburkholderia sp. BL6665CI2N2]